MNSSIAWIKHLLPDLTSELKQYRRFFPSHSIYPNVPCLHIDDFSGISLLPTDPLAHPCYGSRAFVRARNGDLVAGTWPPVNGFKEYINNFLNLGNVEYFQIRKHPQCQNNPFKALIADEKTIIKIGNLVRNRGGKLIIHPYMGHKAVWTLAENLAKICGIEVKVLAPFPGITNLVNNRIQFAEIVRAILGPESALINYPASNIGDILRYMAVLSTRNQAVALRVANSATGLGCRIFDTKLLQSLSSSNLKKMIEEWLREVSWNRAPQYSVERWETDVLCSPSIQVWIPCLDEGSPIVDGIFNQEFDSQNPVKFVGSTPSQLNSKQLNFIKMDTVKICQVLQQLGYIGRCSFDVIICGRSWDESTHRFVECNGRWGGTSTPMAFMNRLFGDHRDQSYVAQTIELHTKKKIRFSEIISYLKPILYNVKTSKGWVILYNPACVETIGTLDAITIGETYEEAKSKQGILKELLDKFFTSRCLNVSN